VAGGDPERAVALYSGSFLDGSISTGSPSSSGGRKSERARLAHRAASAMEQAAQRATHNGVTVTAPSSPWRQHLADDQTSSIHA